VNDIDDRQAGINPRFVAVYAYVDTLEFFVRRHPRKGIRAEWESALGRKKVQLNKCRDRNGNLCGYRITIQRPKLYERDILDQLQERYRAVLRRFDVAIDWTFLTEAEKELWRSWLEQHVLLRWHRGKMHDYCGTLYWIRQIDRKRTIPRNLKIYSSRPSKVSGEQHCVHVELSFFRAASCRAQRIHKTSDLFALNPRTLVGKHVKLVEGVEEFLQKRIRAAIKDDRARHLATKYHSEKSRDFCDKHCRVTPQQVRYYWKQRGLRAQVLKARAGLKKTVAIDALKLPFRITSTHNKHPSFTLFEK